MVSSSCCEMVYSCESRQQRFERAPVTVSLGIHRDIFLPEGKAPRLGRHSDWPQSRLKGRSSQWMQIRVHRKCSDTCCKIAVLLC